MVSLEREIKEAPPAPIPNPIMIADQQKLSRKRSSCPNLKMYVKDQNGEVRGMDVDLSPTMDLPGGTMDVEASYIEEKCCFLVPNGFMSGKKDGRRSSAEVRKVFLQKSLYPIGLLANFEPNSNLCAWIKNSSSSFKKFQRFQNTLSNLFCWQSMHT